ncbi:MAG: hypothetical protein ACI9KN_001887 [Gammaproteobacteria bacterium]|jgi:hypothetical protein
MKIITSILLILFTTGCTHYLYQGDFIAKTSQDEVSQFRLWWSKTEPWIGDEKAGPIILSVECAAPITFTESSEGIVFEGGSDKYESTIGEAGPVLICGKLTNLKRSLHYNGGKILLTSSCKPIADEFAAIEPILLSPDVPTYKIPIKMTKDWSILSSALSADPLECP